MEKKPLGNFLIYILVKGCESESDTEPESDQVFVAFARVMSGSRGITIETQKSKQFGSE
jgi:hypothetical protein